MAKPLKNRLEYIQEEGGFSRVKKHVLKKKVNLFYFYQCLPEEEVLTFLETFIQDKPNSFAALLTNPNTLFSFGACLVKEQTPFLRHLLDEKIEQMLANSYTLFLLLYANRHDCNHLCRFLDFLGHHYWDKLVKIPLSPEDESTSSTFRQI